MNIALDYCAALTAIAIEAVADAAYGAAVRCALDAELEVRPSDFQAALAALGRTSSRSVVHSPTITREAPQTTYVHPPARWSHSP